jgi:prepilin-type N-terminal cleavage/methylation domain-containing protein
MKGVPAYKCVFLSGRYMMMVAKTRQRKGFTLIEAIMATVLLAIAATGVIHPFAAGAAVQAEGWRRSLAAKLASDLLEEVIDTDYDQIASTWTSYTEAQGGVKDYRGVVFTDLAYAKFSRDVTLQTTTDLANIEHLWVTVRVYRNGDETAKLSTLVIQ